MTNPPLNVLLGIASTVEGCVVHVLWHLSSDNPYFHVFMFSPFHCKCYQPPH